MAPAHARRPRPGLQGEPLPHARQAPRGTAGADRAADERGGGARRQAGPRAAAAAAHLPRRPRAPRRGARRLPGGGARRRDLRRCRCLRLLQQRPGRVRAARRAPVRAGLPACGPGHHPHARRWAGAARPVAWAFTTGTSIRTSIEGSAVAEYQYVMKGLTKVVPPGKEILKGIWLSFYPGAKIGVIGPNGAGKSTLLRIMAGVDAEFEGEAWPGQGVSVGYLPQEPRLDESKDVKGNIMEGVGEAAALLERFNELSMKMAEDLPDDEMAKVYTEFAEVQDAIETAGAWDIDRTLEIAMDALRVPAGDAAVATPVSY